MNIMSNYDVCMTLSINICLHPFYRQNHHGDLHEHETTDPKAAENSEILRRRLLYKGPCL